MLLAVMGTTPPGGSDARVTDMRDRLADVGRRRLAPPRLRSTTAPTTTRRRPRSWTRGGRGSCAPIFDASVGPRDRQPRHPDRRREPPEPHRLVVPGRLLRPRAEGLAHAARPARDGSRSRARTAAAACSRRVTARLWSIALAGGRRSDGRVRERERRRRGSGRSPTRTSGTRPPASRRSRRSSGRTVRRSSRSCRSRSASAARRRRAPAARRRSRRRICSSQMKNRAIDTHRSPRMEVEPRPARRALADFGDPRRRRRLRPLRLRRRHARVSRTTAPAGGTCRGGRPCWRQTSTGWTFTQSRPPATAASRRSRSAPAATARRSVQAKGKGGLLSPAGAAARRHADPRAGRERRRQVLGGDLLNPLAERFRPLQGEERPE